MKNKGYAEIRGQIKCIMGNVKVAYEDKFNQEGVDLREPPFFLINTEVSCTIFNAFAAVSINETRG